MKSKERLKYVAVTDCVSLVPVRMVPQVSHMLIVDLIAPKALVKPPGFKELSDLFILSSSQYILVFFTL